MGMGPFGPGRRSRPGGASPTGPEGLRSGPEFATPSSGRRSRSSWAPPTYPWQWSAGVLAGLAAASVLVLATRVRGLDRLR
jgi:ABC-2 type transport system permease protein